jgi:hypothetical protein
MLTPRNGRQKPAGLEGAHELSEPSSTRFVDLLAWTAEWMSAETPGRNFIIKTTGDD